MSSFVISAVDLEVGDQIIENGKPHPVKKLDKTICKHHVHVNGKDCYDNGAEVRISEKRTKLTDEEVSNDFYTKSPILN